MPDVVLDYTDTVMDAVVKINKALESIGYRLTSIPHFLPPRWELELEPLWSVSSPYIVVSPNNQYFVCPSLSNALECKGREGGLIYEPLGMSAAKRISRNDMMPVYVQVKDDTSMVIVVERINKLLNTNGYHLHTFQRQSGDRELKLDLLPFTCQQLPILSSEKSLVAG